MSQGVLLLNNTYEALSVVTLKRAVRLLYARRAEVIHDNGNLLRSAGNRNKVIVEFKLPSIIRLLYYVTARPKRLALTKKNVLLRDSYECAYCGVTGGREMTVDHVKPKHQGGKSTWENLVAACSPCNTRKRNRTPEEAQMKLRWIPKRPTHVPWAVIKRHTYPDEWAKYLGLWSISIEQRPA